MVFNIRENISNHQGLALILWQFYEISTSSEVFLFHNGITYYQMTCHMSTTKNIFVVKIYIYCSTCYFFKWYATELYDQNQEYMFVTSI